VLNERGRVRAQALVGEIGEMNITAIYCPDLVRNIDTAKPLAKHLGLKIETFSDMSKVHEVIEANMSRHSGEVILWVGNTSNLPQFYSRLGGARASRQPNMATCSLSILSAKVFRM